MQSATSKVNRLTVAGPEILKRRGNVLAPSNYSANENNQLYAFYAGKGILLKRILKPIKGGCPPPVLPRIRHCRLIHTDTGYTTAR